MNRVAIAGVTGYVGGRLAPRLLEAGHRLRCLVRSPRKLEGRDWTNDPRVEVWPSNLADQTSLTRDLAGCDAAFYLVHSMMSSDRAYANQDLALALTFAASARDAGVGRIIYLGGLGEMGPGLSEHLESRRHVETALASTGVPVTVLRAAMIIGSGSASFEILRYLVHRLPVMITPTWVSTRCQPIAIENVLNYLVGVLSVADTTGEVFHIGGREIRSYRDIMRIMAEELGLPRRWIIPVPLLTPRLSSHWIQLVTPLSHRIARPLAEGLKNEVVCRDDRITRHIPQALLDVRESIHAALSQVKAHLVETHWSMAGPMPGDPDWAGGDVFRDVREQVVRAAPQQVFDVIARIGGRQGWFRYNRLWRLRGILDRVTGGPGWQRGRRNPSQLAWGEVVDFWRVVEFERDRRLTLRAEMRLPGDAVLDFELQPMSDGTQAPATRLLQTARFRPRGLAGLLYWYSVMPFHALVFKGLLQGIAEAAEARH